MKIAKLGPLEPAHKSFRIGGLDRELTLRSTSKRTLTFGVGWVTRQQPA